MRISDWSSDVCSSDLPVTGAGCIEAFTPLDNIGDPFDDRMETIRNRSEAIADPDTAQRYRDFATAYAKDWAAEHGDHMMYSLDQRGRGARARGFGSVGRRRAAASGRRRAGLSRGYPPEIERKSVV